MDRRHQALVTVLGGGSTPAFSPLDITGMQVWFDFSDTVTLFQDSAGTTPVTADGQEIGKVADKSGNNRHATQSTATKLPLYKTAIQNSLSVARFDGSNDLLKTATFTLNQPTQIFIVFADRGLASEKTVLDGFAVNRMLLYRYASSFLALYAGSNPIGNFLPSLNETLLVTSLYNAGSSQIAKNSGATFTGATTIGTQNGAGLTMGGRADGTQCGQSDICEVLVYNAALSAANKLEIENYLNAKWQVFF